MNTLRWVVARLWGGNVEMNQKSLLKRMATEII